MNDFFANIVLVPSNRNQRKRIRIEAAQNDNNDVASSASASGAPEDLWSKSDRDLKLMIQKMSKNVDVLGPKLKDGGAKFKSILKLYKDEFEHRTNNDNDVASSALASAFGASEDLSSINDCDLELMTQRLSRNVDVLGPILKDGGAKYKIILKLYKDESDRRKLRRAQ